MNYSMAKQLIDEESDHPMDRTLPPTANVAPLALHYPKWKMKALLIEALIIVFGFVSVLIYNFLFSAQISPVLGVIIGAVNGSLVAWCITHADLSGKTERRKNRSHQHERG